MKKSVIIGVLIVGLIAISIGLVSAQHGQSKGCVSANFVDENGDGVCDNPDRQKNFVDEDSDGVCDNIGENGRDHDGDGIPNEQDTDYIKNARNGNGHEHGHNR